VSVVVTSSSFLFCHHHSLLLLYSRASSFNSLALSAFIHCAVLEAMYSDVTSSLLALLISISLLERRRRNECQYQKR
jgi:hypothetical protein